MLYLLLSILVFSLILNLAITIAVAKGGGIFTNFHD